MSVSKMPIRTNTEKGPEGIAIHGNTEGALRHAIANKEWSPFIPDEEVIELAAAIDGLIRGTEKYIEYLRERRNSELPLTKELATATLNNLKQDIIHLCELEDSLGEAIQLRQEEARDPKENLLQVVFPGEE